MCVSPSADVKAILKEGVANGWAWSPEGVSLSPIEKAVIDSINSHTHISLSHAHSTPPANSNGVTKSNVISCNSVQHEKETESQK